MTDQSGSQSTVIAVRGIAVLSALLHGAVSGVLAQTAMAVQAWRSDTAIFSTPRSIVVTPDCVVWVADPRSGLYRFSCHGQYLGGVGRVGSGPGEWRRPWLVAATGGDTVALFDPNLQRLTYYNSSGRLLRLRPLSIVEQSHGRVMALSANKEDRILVWTDNYPGGDFRPNEQDSYVWIVDHTGLPRDSLIRFPGPQSVVNREERRVSRIDAPFRRRPWVLLGRHDLVVGNSGDSTFVVYGLDGSRRTSFTLPLSALRVTAPDRRQYQDSVRASYFEEIERLRYGPELRGQFSESFGRLMSLVRYPALWQRFDLAAAGDDNTMWLLMPSRGGYERSWLHADATGRILGRISVLHHGNVVGACFSGSMMFVLETTRADQVSSLAAYRWRTQ